MDYNVNKPIYRQIADYVMKEVLLEHWKSGDKVLSVRQLAVKMQVNQNTVFRSFEWLVSHEIIIMKRGIGYFVTEEAKRIVTDIMKDDFYKNHLPRFQELLDLLKLKIEDVINYKTNNKS